jgi:hypothetical protein
MRQTAQERRRASRSTPEAVLRKTTRNSADRSVPQPIHRSLDHVIGVRIPASQPHKIACVSNNLQHRVISLSNC